MIRRKLQLSSVLLRQNRDQAQFVHNNLTTDTSKPA
jgi:hypothetical protein